ncbi:MAG: class I SAM-dependent methyltransferase [Candidatus Hydrogenedentes bacterium]|nr:class I SAM-dependent methyltransferase [Candidatus Hydrogenedentota bacterium]
MGESNLGPDRRMGDQVEIDGGYQYRALTSGNPVQRFWHESKQLVIGDFLPPAPTDFVLDVGCGSGVISQYLGGFGAKVLGVDGSNAAIDFARTRFSADNVTFVHGYVDEHLDLEQGVDKIYCLEVIEHVFQDQGLKMLRAFHDLLKPGGKALLSTPNYHSLWPVIEWGMDRFSGAAHMDKDQHVCHYTPRRLTEACERAGFAVETLKTWCFVAPWLAPLNVRAARAVHRIELKSPVPVGSLILAVATKPV